MYDEWLDIVYYRTECGRLHEHIHSAVRAFTRESRSCAAILTKWSRQHTPPLLLFINNVKQMSRGEEDGAQGKGGEGSVVEDKNYKQNFKV